MARQFKQLRAAHRGFTLVELMVVVMIISVLATITLFALVNAGEAAKKARTRMQIAKIHDLIMPLWESYLTRRAPVNTAGMTPKAAAKARVDAMRELVRLELPDRFSDVMQTNGSKVKKSLPSYPALYEGYHRRATTAAWHNPQTPGDNYKHQGAECLYMIVAQTRDGDSSGLEHFRADEIGDVDVDKMPEILDGWGTPIRFLRWAPGFVKPNSSLQNGTDPDPFDPTGVYSGTFALFPLIMSAGADKEWDIGFDVASGSPLDYGSGLPGTPVDAFANTSLGSPDDNNSNNGGTPQEHFDNLHNHMIDISIR